MRRLLVTSIGSLLVGAGFFVTFIVALVGVAGVPFHDGPNAGHVHPPGASRWIEENAVVPLFLVAAAAIVVGVVEMVVYLVWRAVRR